MLTIRQFTVADVDFGMRLKNQAKWNQTAADWHRAIALDPAGCFVGRWNGVDAATLTTCTFDDVAWIAMVLTDPQFRGRGIASGLMRHALDYLSGRGAQSVRLDATQFGLPVYEKLGFQTDWMLTRFGGCPIVEPAAGDAPIVRLRPDQVDSVAELDRRATGTNRRALLEQLLADEAARSLGVFNGLRLTGFCLERSGSNAEQVGPCIAEDESIGSQLLAAACRNRRTVYIDVPDDNPPASRWCSRAGLVAERQFYRMTFGKPVREERRSIWASYGPEKG
jgi:GNAT superfamily N-acetyltransferase